MGRRAACASIRSTTRRFCSAVWREPMNFSVNIAPQIDLAPTADDDWYKDAIIYQLHVKAFADSNNDGIGDFAGLTDRLDYLQDLGVTALWLLPFYPSPRPRRRLRHRRLRRHQSRFRHACRISAASCARRKRRGLRVITELVINHTSDQHPWFQRARRSAPGSSARNWYVWSDTDQKYTGTRIIFTDTEKSNWTWDPDAERLLLAPLLLASARSEFRQSAGARARSSR